MMTIYFLLFHLEESFIVEAPLFMKRFCTVVAWLQQGKTAYILKFIILNIKRFGRASSLF